MNRFISRLQESWQSASSGRRAAVLTVFCAILFILVNWRDFVVDDIPQSLVPVTLWREGTIRLDSVRPKYEELKETRQHYAFTESNGHLYPRNSVYVSFLIAPLYLPAILTGRDVLDYRFWVAWGTVCSAVFTAIAVALTYLTLRRWVNDGSALMLSLLYAFGTCLWTVIGHTVYDHLGGLVCVAALAWTLHPFPLSTPRAFGAAFLAGASVGMRPCTVVLLFPLGLYLFFWPGLFAGLKARLAALVGILLIPASNAALNSWCFGAWYKTGYPSDLATDWGNPWWEGMTGLLVAPNSGLFTQSPFMFLGVLGVWVVWRDRAQPDGGLLRAYSLCFAAYWVLFAHRNEWQGGLDFATRYLSEGYPLWMPLVAVGWKRASLWRGACPFLALAGGWSVFYQLANLATFDMITTLNPKHVPWDPRRHFFAVVLEQRGLVAAAQAILWNLVKLALCALTLGCLLERFLRPTPATSLRLAEQPPDDPTVQNPPSPRLPTRSKS